MNKDYPLNYSADVLNIISKMTFNSKNVDIIGSASLRNQQYAGDYDLNERVNGSPYTIVKGLKRIIRDLLKYHNCYIGDIKCGVINDFKVIDGSVVKDKIVGFDVNASLNKLHCLQDAGIINNDVYANAKELLLNIKDDIYKFLNAKKELNFEVCRWKPKDILNGFLVIADGSKLYLTDAIQTDGLTKIDVICFLDSTARFTDFSIIYTFVYKGVILNDVKIDVLNDLNESLLYYEGNKNYYKMAKRIYALARLNEDTNLVNTLNELFNGDCGRLYSIINDANTILFLIDNKDVIDATKIRVEIDAFRSRLGNIYTIQGVNKKSILSDILSINTLPINSSILVSQMQRLIDYFQIILDKSAFAFLIEHTNMRKRF